MNKLKQLPILDTGFLVALLDAKTAIIAMIESRWLRILPVLPEMNEMIGICF